MPDPGQPPFRWRKADESDYFRYCPQHEGKNIFYAGEYTSGAGFNFSETNNLIYNLKKRPGCSQAEAHFKRMAIQQCANECVAFLARFLGGGRALLVPMPPSKAEGEEGYDDRLLQVGAKIAAQCTQVRVLPLLRRSSSRPFRHLGEIGRQVEVELLTLTLAERILGQEPAQGEILVILDDVCTSGASFEAARQLLAELYPQFEIMGLMWAKAKTRSQQA